MRSPLNVVSSVTGTGSVNISFADGAPFRFLAVSFGIPVDVAFEAMIETTCFSKIQRRRPVAWKWIGATMMMAMTIGL
jgi:hypothetical protein